jgi:hypothetical protein
VLAARFGLIAGAINDLDGANGPNISCAQLCYL